MSTIHFLYYIQFYYFFEPIVTCLVFLHPIVCPVAALRPTATIIIPGRAAPLETPRRIHATSTGIQSDHSLRVHIQSMFKLFLLNFANGLVFVALIKSA